jgi:hypothetical protein
VAASSWPASFSSNITPMAASRYPGSPSTTRCNARSSRPKVTRNRSSRRAASAPAGTSAGSWSGVSGHTPAGSKSYGSPVNEKPCGTVSSRTSRRPARIEANR